MAVRTLISEGEYLSTSFEGPEPDYVDGELVERSMPNCFHARTQVRLGDAFKTWEDRGALFRLSDLRIRVAPARYRVADFALLARQQTTAIPQDVPIAVFEIASPDDRHEELLSKSEDYVRAGVRYIFHLEPAIGRLFRYQEGSLIAAASIEMPEYGVSIPIASVLGA